MFGGCVCVCVCVFRGVCTCVCVLVCVDVDVYERIRKFSECQTGSEQRAFIVQGEDAYRGRLPRTPPCFSGAFSPVRARMGPRPIKARPFEPNGCRRGGEREIGARRKVSSLCSAYSSSLEECYPEQWNGLQTRNRIVTYTTNPIGLREPSPRSILDGAPPSERGELDVREVGHLDVDLLSLSAAQHIARQFFTLHRAYRDQVLPLPDVHLVAEPGEGCQHHDLAHVDPGKVAVQAVDGKVRQGELQQAKETVDDVVDGDEPPKVFEAAGNGRAIA